MPDLSKIRLRRICNTPGVTIIWHVILKNTKKEIPFTSREHFEMKKIPWKIFLKNEIKGKN